MIQKLPLTLRRDTSGTCMVGVGGGCWMTRMDPRTQEGQPELMGCSRTEHDKVAKNCNFFIS